MNIIIDAPTKKVLLEQLESLNIHGGAVYPDLTHMSNYIRHKYLDKKKTTDSEIFSSVDLGTFDDKNKKKPGNKKPSKEDFSKIWESLTEKKPEPTIIVKQLTSNFDSSEYWSLKRIEMLASFANKNDLKADETKKLIEDIIAFGKKPMRDEFIDVLISKPSLKERTKAAEELSLLINSFVEELRNTKE